MPENMIANMDIFICPACEGDLNTEGGYIKCRLCGNQYETREGIPLFFMQEKKNQRISDVTEKIKSFYEKTPFPNYEEVENISDLIEKAQRGIFARLLNKQIPFNIRVLEVGCGTGQLSNFLGIAHRYVFGTDLCFNSLKLAEEFRQRNGLSRVGFYQMNLFKPIFKKESFPLVICNGVLHHTPDPFGGFQSIAKLVKRGGYILIGLYNRYGRIGTDIRRVIFRLFGSRLFYLDPCLRKAGLSDLKKDTWFQDQYNNPHELRHSVGDVLKWFGQTGFEYVNSIPKLTAFQSFSAGEKLFRTNPKGNWFDHFIVQSQLLFSRGREGGFFIMIGRKMKR